MFVKNVNSALHKSVGLSEYLFGKSVKKIIAVGLQTNFCIDATIHTGFDLGFEMIVPEYANSTFDSEYMSAETAYRYYNEFFVERKIREVRSDGRCGENAGSIVICQTIFF